MADVLIRNVSEETRRALKQRAASSGRSVNAEILAVLNQAVDPEDRVSPLTLLESIKRKRLRRGEAFTFDLERDQSGTRIPDFSSSEFEIVETR